MTSCTFELTIGKSVQLRTPQEWADLPKSPALNLTPLDQRTIDILITILRENRASGLEEFEVLGERLYAALFLNPDGEANAVGAELRKALDDVRPDLLRLELVFEEGAEKIATWPWEYLYRPGRGFLVTEPTLILTRRLLLESTPRAFKVDRPPVRILFVAVQPKVVETPLGGDAGEHLGPVEWEPMWEVLEQLAAASDGQIEAIGYIGEGRSENQRGEMPAVPRNGDQPAPPLALTPGEPRLSVANFAKLVMYHQPHVVHFVGHGQCDDITGKGRIALLAPDGGPAWYAQNDLAMTMRGVTDLRLVFLQACETAASTRSDPYLAVSGVAATLASLGIPAVVGMNFKVQNAVANTFAKDFYAALRDHLTLDVAVQRGRRAVQTQFSDWAQKRGFALPVLYSRLQEPLLAAPSAATAPSGRGTTAGETTASTMAVPCQFCGKQNLFEQPECVWCRRTFICPKCERRLTTNFCGDDGTALPGSEAPHDSFAAAGNGR